MAENLKPKTGAFGQSPDSLIAQLELALDHYARLRLVLPRHQRQVEELALRVASTGSEAVLPVLERHLAVTRSAVPVDYFVSHLLRPETLSLPLLLSLLTTLKTHQMPGALRVAELLVEKAERERTRDFAAALSLLKPGLATPLEFVGLRKRLVEALKGNNFPIPAEAEADAADLPLPSQNRKS